MNELLINGTDALGIGVRMGDGFIDTLFQPIALKEHISNETPLQHGTQYLPTKMMASRSLSLVFTIEGRDKEAFLANKKAFLSILYEANISIAVPIVGNEVFHLIYTGKSVSYEYDLTGCFCKIAVGLVEPNPNSRN